jgi:hypothetical protein
MMSLYILRGKSLIHKAIPVYRQFVSSVHTTNKLPVPHSGSDSSSR